MLNCVVNDTTNIHHPTILIEVDFLIQFKSINCSEIFSLYFFRVIIRCRQSIYLGNCTYCDFRCNDTSSRVEVVKAITQVIRSFRKRENLKQKAECHIESINLIKFRKISIAYFAFVGIIKDSMARKKTNKYHCAKYIYPPYHIHIFTYNLKRIVAILSRN